MVVRNKNYLFLALLTLSSSLHTMNDLAHLQAGHIQHFLPIDFQKEDVFTQAERLRAAMCGSEYDVGVHDASKERRKLGDAEPNLGVPALYDQRRFISFYHIFISLRSILQVDGHFSRFSNPAELKRRATIGKAVLSDLDKIDRVGKADRDRLVRSEGRFTSQASPVVSGDYIAYREVVKELSSLQWSECSLQQFEACRKREHPHECAAHGCDSCEECGSHLCRGLIPCEGWHEGESTWDCFSPVCLHDLELLAWYLGREITDWKTYRDATIFGEDGVRKILLRADGISHPTYAFTPLVADFR